MQSSLLNRPKLKENIMKIFKNPVLLVSAVMILIVTCGLFVVLYFNFYLNSQPSKETQKVSFTIRSGEGVRQITKELKDSKLIKHDLVLLVYLEFKGLADELKAGHYEIAKNSTPFEIVDTLTNGKVASVKITVPEGWTVEEIGNYLAQKNIVTKADFLQATKKSYSYEFLKDVPAGASLEGFLFPDTYQISKEATADQIVQKMLENFDAKIDTQTKSEIAASKFSLYEIVTLASIVEREVSKPQDRKIVAGVFEARLDEGMRLESDVTVLYGLGVVKEDLTYEDTGKYTPYNTYAIDGLPVGPISNPGLESIKAVLHPEMTQFRYFLAVDGTTYFAKTLDEHNILKEKYLN